MTSYIDVSMQKYMFAMQENKGNIAAIPVAIKPSYPITGN